MMSSNLCGLLGLGSINKLAVCKCRSVGVSMLFSLPLPQKGSVSGSCYIKIGADSSVQPYRSLFKPWCSAQHGRAQPAGESGAAIKAQRGPEQNTLLGSNFFCSFWDRRVIYCIFLLAFLFFLSLPPEQNENCCTGSD